MALGFDTRGSHCPGFLEAVAATMIRFPKVLIAYWRAFAVGFLVGWFLFSRPMNELELMDERIRKKIRQSYPTANNIDANVSAVSRGIDRGIDP